MLGSVPSAPLDRIALDALEAIDAAIVVFDADQRLVLCNPAFRGLYAPIATLLQPGRPFADLLHAAIDRGLLPEAMVDREGFVARRIEQHRAPGPPIQRQFPGGRWRRIVEKRLDDGHLLGFSTDVSDAVDRERQLEAARRTAQRHRQRLEDAIDALPDGFALYDEDDRLVIANRRYRELYEASAPAIRPGAKFEALLRYGLAHGQYPEAVGQEQAWLEGRLYRHRHPAAPILQALPGNRWLRIDERPTRDGGIAGVRTDVTELVRREQELRRVNAELADSRRQLAALSETDALTGIANRRRFDRVLHEEWLRGARHGLPLALLIVDVDHFKRYNDALGHPLGDHALCEVAQVLQSVGRRSSDLVARYGGEEFALLLPHTTLPEAVALAQACREALAERALPHPDSPLGPLLTFSVGAAAAVPLPAQGSESLVRAADTAVYAAKRGGRDRVATPACA